MVPCCSRITSVQLASSWLTSMITQEPASSPACWPLEKSWSWKTISSPSSGWGFGWRTLFAWINSGGLKTTLKASVFDLAALGPVADDAAAADRAPPAGRQQGGSSRDRQAPGRQAQVL